MATIGIFPLVVYVLLDRMPPLWPTSKKAYLIGQKRPDTVTSFECPYAYIRQVYGKYHWAPFVHKLSPTLKTDDPAKYKMVNEIMDAIHLCLMLVDDVCSCLVSFVGLFFPSAARACSLIADIRTR